MNSAEDLEPKDKKRLKYFSRQIIDMLAPTNFLGTNPDALERALETDGKSLVDGPSRTSRRPTESWLCGWPIPRLSSWAATSPRRRVRSSIATGCWS